MRNAVSTLGLLALLAIAGCSTFSESTDSTPPPPMPLEEGEYLIGPGDSLQIFVWRHEDLSAPVQVRPDGKISTPLVEDMRASGKTPTELARDVEAVLAEYVRTPTVTVIVQSFVGEAQQQVRIVGQAQRPQAMQYRQGMTLLDVMISVGGLSETASGNRAKIVRRVEGQQYEMPVRIDDLLNKGKIDENVLMAPGDVLIIPESIF